MTQKFHDNETATIALYKYHDLLACEKYIDEFKWIVESGQPQSQGRVAIEQLTRVYLRMLRSITGSNYETLEFYSIDDETTVS